jgi:hypothetical protein
LYIVLKNKAVIPTLIIDDDETWLEEEGWVDDRNNSNLHPVLSILVISL